MRIVSLLPGATESLFALGVGDQVVGVSHECDFPEAAGRLPRLTRSTLDLDGLDGGEIDRRVSEAAGRGDALYEVDLERLRDLSPDLIVTQDVCEVCAVPGRLLEGSAGRARILRQHPHTLDDVIAGIGELADAVGGETALAARLSARLDALRRRVAGLPRVRMVFLEWLDPPFPAGHWTPDIVDLAGGDDPLATPARPSVATSWEAVRAARPELLVLAPCGMDGPRAEVEMARMEFEVSRCGAARVVVLDGSAYFNRPGPRLVESAELLARSVHGEALASPQPAGKRR